MNRPLAESVQLPPRGQLQVTERIVEKPVKPSLASRVWVSVLGTTIYNFILGNLGLSWIPFVLAGVLGLIGWKVSPPKAIADKAQAIEERIEHAADKVVGGIEDKARKAAPGGLLPGLPHGKTPEQLLAKDRAEADALGLAWGEDWTHEKFEVELRLAKKAQADAERQAAEDRERAALIERATKIGFGVNPDLDLKEMKRQIVEAEAAVKADEAFQLAHRRWEEAMKDYHAFIAKAPNANCPACRFPLRLRTTNPQYQTICPRCGFVSTRRIWLSMHRDPPPPPEPQPVKRNPGLFGRFFR
jgi:hypothetical protein